MVERLILDHEVETTYPFSAYFWAADKVQRWDPLTDKVLPSEIKNRWPLIIIGLLPFALVVLALVILPFYLGSLFFSLMYELFPGYDLSVFGECGSVGANWIRLVCSICNFVYVCLALFH